MISRVKVSDWRALDCREFEFKEGLNVIAGRNERGKSSLVEAIGKALYWDHRAHPKAEMKLKEIMPVGRTGAIPTVELDLHFDDYDITVRKVVHYEAAKRRCSVVVRTAGKLQPYEDRQAHERLVELLTEYGIEDRLGVSVQGRGAALIHEGLPPMSREVLHVSQDGAIFPTKRLQSIRKSVDAACDQALIKALKVTVTDSLRENTEARRLLCELDDAQRKIAQMRELRQDIDSRRRRLRELEVEQVNFVQQLKTAEEELDRLRSIRQTQQTADHAFLEASNAEQVASNQLDKLSETIDRIKALARQIREDDSRLTELRKAESDAKAELTDIESKRDEALRGLGSAELRLNDAEGLRQALGAEREVRRCTSARRDLEVKLTAITTLEAQLTQAKRTREELPTYPSGEKIGIWRGRFGELEQLRKDAAQKLQVDLLLDRSASLRWTAVGKAENSGRTEAGEEKRLGAVRTLMISIDGVGSIRVRSGAAELDEILRQIQTVEDRLNDEIAPLGVTVTGLPVGFALLEERLTAGRSAEEAVAIATANLKTQEKNLGTCAALKGRFQDVVRELTVAADKRDPLSRHIPEELSDADLSVRLGSAGDLADDLKRQFNSASTRVDAFSDALQSKATNRATLEARLQEFEPLARARKAELERLRSDGLTDERRATELVAVQLTLVSARAAVREAENARLALGDAVSDKDVGRQAGNLKAIRDREAMNRDELNSLKATIEEKCGRDPDGEIEGLEEEADVLSAKLSAEEVRLSAHLLLRQLLRAEQQRLGRLLCEPLNQRVSPWLQQIRGLPTTITLEEHDLKFTQVITERNGKTEPLAFAELSDGCREQVGFVIRLVLAGLVADKSAGRRPFLILDDPLTQTDRHRRPDLYRVLAQAAQKLQILFVTCHDDTLAALPATAHRVEM